MRSGLVSAGGEESLCEEAHHAPGFALARAVHDESLHGSDEGFDDELPLGGGDRAALDGSPEVVRIAPVGPLVELGDDGRDVGSLVDGRDESGAAKVANYERLVAGVPEFAASIATGGLDDASALPSLEAAGFEAFLISDPLLAAPDFEAAMKAFAGEAFG